MAQELKEVEYPNCFGSYYRKDEVDAVLAEKDAEIARLQKELEHSNVELESYFVFEDEIKAELRATRRSLWIARAERAASWQIHFSLSHNHSIGREFAINGASMECEGMLTMRTARDWAMIWKNVARKCRAKAEEYK